MMMSNSAHFWLRTALLLALFLVLICPAEADTQSLEAPWSKAGEDPGELLDGYVSRLFGLAPEAESEAIPKSINIPTGSSRVLYNELTTFIEDVAAGRITDTVFTTTLTPKKLGLPTAKWSARELGVSAVWNGTNITEEANAAALSRMGLDFPKTTDALFLNHPYELYWCERVSFEYGNVSCYNENGVDYVDYENLEVIFRFQVAKEFAQRASETTVYYYKTRADIATAAVRAAENAQAIVQKYADRSNYQKLDAYRWEICNRVSYNHDAWADGHPLMDYGNPWQLVWVFDDDSSTNVVCEGYAKAFQYLCDNSHFKGDLTCYRVNGTMFGGNGSGAHMWNIVHMPDGKNYMVDITNCDDGSIGHARQLFLAGCSSAPDPITYVYHCHGGDVSFVYDDWTLRNYSADQLAMSYTTYAPSSTGLGIEWSNFPDDAFRIYIENEIDRDGDGALSDDEIERTTSLSIYDLGISSLKGIEHFTALEDLTCSDNCLTELDVSRNPMLKWLDCSENQLTALDVSKNYNLTTLSCDYNQLTALDVTQNTALESLNCRENQLTTLDVSLNTKLYRLLCDYNQLAALDVTQNTALWTLNCEYNQITNLDVSRNTVLGKLYCNSNQLTDLDVSSNHQLEELYCSKNKLTALDVSQNPNLRKLYCYDNSIKELDISECPALIEKREDDYYLNVDENVQLIYSAGIAIDASVFPDEIFRSYISETFDTDSNGLLSPKEIRAVISIDINEKDIQSLDGIQTFTALQTLNCEYNLLTELDVSENPVLTELDCAENQLLSLDVSHNPALTALYCSDNPLKALDLSHNTELMILGCSNDQLTSLDVSPLEALTELYCDNNQLTQLDVSHNPALNTLRCENNQLTVLDVSHNPELVIFSCGTNALTTLDVSQNALLRHMSCESNQLTALDVSNHPALKELFCQRNRLRLLNVSGDTALSWLFCGQNQLTALNLSDSPALTQLNCDGNRLEIPRGRFDLSELPNLDLARTSNWTGGLIEDGTLISDPFAKRVSYTYDCDGKHRVSFILMLAEEPAPMLLPTGLRRIESEAFINVDARAFILPASIEFIAGDAFPEDAAIYYPIGTDTEAWCLAHSEELPGCLPFQPDA